jgi:hypothetical protein
MVVSHNYKPFSRVKKSKKILKGKKIPVIQNTRTGKRKPESNNFDCVVNLTNQDLNPELIDFKKKIINYITNILDL